MGEEAEAAGLAEPIRFQFGEAGGGGTRPGDGDQVAPGVGEGRGVGADQVAEAAAQEDAVVGFATAFGGDETGADAGQFRVREGAEHQEAAGLGTAGRFDAGEIGASGDAA